MSAREKTVEHEGRHKLAAAIALLIFGANNHKSGLDLINKTTVFFDIGFNEEDNSLGWFGLSLDDVAAQKFAMGCASLAPDVDEDSALLVMKSNSIQPLIKTVSDTDLAAYQDNAVAIDSVLVCGLAADFYLNSLGTKKAKYLSLLDEAARRNDNLLKLADVVSYDRLQVALERAQAFVERKQYELSPQFHDDNQRRRFEAKRTGYANASPAERRRRDGMGIGKTLGF